ncbi:MAG: glutamate-5-semialdehyde dehydrogenase [Clostridia bacterium]|nr:glutamate-5-semialdehyde dehydrogenase [Clostridia bacterium]
MITQAAKARRAAIALSAVSREAKNTALLNSARELDLAREDIISENAIDIAAAREKGVSQAFIERLTLNDARIDSMIEGLKSVARLDDPVGLTLDSFTRPNGLAIRKVSTPLGVIAIIFESRPNVTIDAAALCLKSGNAVILRGGSDAIRSNAVLMNAMRRGVERAGLPVDCVSLVEDTSRETAQRLMRLNEYIDVLIPRGGKSLINTVIKNATVPTIQTGDGVCHVYVDGECDLEMALTIAVSAKISRPSVCNSAETLLIDQKIAARFIPACFERLKLAGVEIRGCEKVREYAPYVLSATDEDWAMEYNDLIYSVKIVDGVNAAIEHINTYGTRHSEAIITRSEQVARKFQNMVDAAAIYWNASTRFTDGGEFGFGAEIGISNQKLHARGPMGLKELTTYKYVIDGAGQVR